MSSTQWGPDLVFLDDTHLATIKLSETWRAAPRRWGHRWHAMCSYMAMFPPAMPRVFIDWLTEKGDVVYDPFSGRGTTALEACLSGRIGLGSDANPLAWVLTSAKASPPSPHILERRLRSLRQTIQFVDVSDQPPEIRAVFHKRVLGQLLWLRKNLSLESTVDRYLYATLVGILHANARTDGTARGLTISMPNTFAMAPRYVMRYKVTHGLRPPNVDVLQMLESRVATLGSPAADREHGHAWMQSAAAASRMPKRYAPAKLIFSSPPYLGVMKYAKLNWLRMWLIGHSPPEIDARLFSSSSLEKYLTFMDQVLTNLQVPLADNGRICLVIGDVVQRGREINLAQAVADSSARTAGLRVDAIINDEIPVRHKVSRIWKDRRGQATRTDRVLILSRGKKTRLPRVPAFDWT